MRPLGPGAYCTMDRKFIYLFSLMVQRIGVGNWYLLVWYSVYWLLVIYGIYQYCYTTIIIYCLVVSSPLVWCLVFFFGPSIHYLVS